MIYSNHLPYQLVVTYAHLTTYNAADQSIASKITCRYREGWTDQLIHGTADHVLCNDDRTAYGQQKGPRRKLRCVKSTSTYPDTEKMDPLSWNLQCRGHTRGQQGTHHIGPRQPPHASAPTLPTPKGHSLAFESQLSMSLHTVAICGDDDDFAAAAPVVNVFSSSSLSVKERDPGELGSVNDCAGGQSCLSSSGALSASGCST